MAAASSSPDAPPAPAASPSEKSPAGARAVDEPPSPSPAAHDAQSPGVARAAALSAALTTADRVAIFAGVFLIAYAYGLDGSLRFVYQTAATASFGRHSLLATVNVVRAVIAAAAQPTAAKIADVFGRVELICLSVFFYVLGTVIEASATNVDVFAGGSVIYQVGYTMILLLVEVIIADVTSTRSRLFFSYLPTLPFIINTWVGGNIADAVLASTTWHWGVGMWAVIYPLCALPLVVSLALASRRARRQGRLAHHRSSRQLLGWRLLSRELFWLLDLVGLGLMIALFALILVPLTLAGGFQSSWRSAHVIAPLVLGVLCIPVFVVWELRAPHPLVPFALMRDRAVWAPMGIAVMLNFAWTMQGDYLFSVLRVAFDFSVLTATRIQSLYSFTSVIVGPLVGLAVFAVRRLKVFVMAGTALYMVAFGLLIRYRGSPSADSRAGVIGAQVLLGVAGGLFPYTAQASLQVGLRHENVAVMTGIYLAMYNIGSALGNAVSGAMWTQVLPAKLDETLAGVNSTLAALAFADPFANVVAVYPIGTPERTAVVDAFQSVQRILCITGVCLCLPLIFFSLMLRNPRLTDAQNLVEGEAAPSEAEVEVEAASEAGGGGHVAGGRRRV